MTMRSLSKLIVSLSLLACTSVFAAPLVVNVAGIRSYAAEGSSANTVLSFNVGAFATITDVSYNVNVTAFRPSYLSELSLYFGDTDQSTGVFFTPGFEDDHPGTASYAGSASLVDLGLDFQVGADGLLRLEFYEDFNDASVSPDGMWNFGTITFTTDAVDTPPGNVPEPASGLLMGAGLALMAYSARRRHAKDAA
ncbi:PEP-CTERM sorting domain-containing protein [Massilia sp. S19_KUP03_FR1]|uniref:PEP-CTERM sorting domain-containing protein n=1 Tax=Massilia sp. S19_KUP03_FR1 TaxID=3025503 RepID=UPI002FCCF14A